MSDTVLFWMLAGVILAWIVIGYRYLRLRARRRNEADVLKARTAKIVDPPLQGAEEQHDKDLEAIRRLRSRMVMTSPQSRGIGRSGMPELPVRRRSEPLAASVAPVDDSSARSSDGGMGVVVGLVVANQLGLFDAPAADEPVAVPAAVQDTVPAAVQDTASYTTDTNFDAY